MHNERQICLTNKVLKYSEDFPRYDLMIMGAEDHGTPLR